jgi:hypothetical protein
MIIRHSYFFSIEKEMNQLKKKVVKNNKILLKIFGETPVKSYI